MNIQDSQLIFYSKQLKKNGYVSIPNILEGDFAEKIYQCLINDVSWGISCNASGEGEVYLNVNSVEELEQKLNDDIKSMQKTDQFQFIYNTYMMVTAYIEKRDPNLFLNRVLEWLNSQATISYFRQLTGNQRFIKLSAQATRYMPGHYLTKHSDIHSGEGREYAYILGLTKGWKADWGGLLHIMDKDENVVKTLVPQFNRLNIFKVPQDHFVSYVSPMAQKPRLAITGWLLSK